MEFTGITTMLDESPVLYRLGLRLEPGHVTVVMGPSGAGKTTLVRHLAGLTRPGRGSVTVDGRDVWTADEAGLRSIRQDLSVLFGGPSVFEAGLFGSLSVYDNIAFALQSRGMDDDSVARITRYRLREMRLHDRASAMPSELAAHGRKRLAIARTLAVEAPLLVLDELEVGLDSVHASAVIGAVREQHERTGATVLITTHDIDLARELGDTVAILCNGHIAATGTPAQLLNGITDSETFEHRFRTSDFLGPPDTDSTLAELERREGGRMIQLEPQQMIVALLAIAFVTSFCVFLLMTR
ncbi:ABC transporter ATP-binding protein [Pseudonocardia sp. ICBG1034]|uniref:ABC transporter ATP-binding protein n=1 Tax=Pseudonocardia sp. ICBG1034 TaxID=2844381 RepID=UPI001CCA941D|nr:ATP-binding cassette domain-containing protein [Pseudonocardia sp. ICBG1034]